MRNLLSLMMLSLLSFAIGCSSAATNSKTDNSATTGKKAETTAANKPEDSGPDGKTDVTMDKFNKLQLGMSYEQVKEIMGVEGKTYPGNSYAWHGENSARINANFTKDKLSSKFQSSILPSKGTAELSLEKASKIKSGASYEAVTKIIGVEGELVSERQSGEAVEKEYRWGGQNYNLIKITFSDNKMTTMNNSNLK